MKTALLIVSGIFVASLAAASQPALALTMKECSAKYQAAKTAGTLNGMKWNDFRKSQCGAETAAPAAAPAAAEKTEPKPAPAPAAATTAGEKKPVSPGRQAMLNRMHACSAEWKTMKAENKRPAGLKWPQFWHECDQRKKAEGM